MSIQPDELVFIVDETHKDRVCDRKMDLCQNEAVLTIEWVCVTCSAEAKRAYCLPHEAIYFADQSGRVFSDGQRHATCLACLSKYPNDMQAKRVYPVERS